MEIVTGDRYLESLVKFVEKNAGGLIEGTITLKLNAVGLHYVQSRLEALHELESLIAGAPVDYLRAYVSDLGDHRALEQLRRILCRLTILKIVSVLPTPTRDPTPVSLLPFGRLKVLELRGCDLSTSAAKGLLELRHTLEKLICHNSTDALRHVFASRIADIKESPQWIRLSFVSCACNGLILMDESLQLLPVVETLDLSRNKFAKVDNLRKCTRLSHLDLGFNQLGSVSLFREVTCRITKLVLRSNALTSLKGIESLKSIEGLDVSYNIISSFMELEVLSSLPSLKNFWLEGNPLCCARWYRPHVFSYFGHPQQVTLDDIEMSKREFWKRQIIVARRQRKPASYGFYTPASEGNEVEGLINGKRKKLSRLACIETEDRGVNTLFEQDSVSCEHDIQGGGEKVVSDSEGEINSLINRIECMKKERSKLWVEDFTGWVDQESENLMDDSRHGPAVLSFGRNRMHVGESSRYSGYVSDSFTGSGDDKNMNSLESNSSFTGSSFNHANRWHDSDTTRANLEGCNTSLSSTPVWELRSSSRAPKSPPYYQEDILYRRHFMEEEFLQLSADSLSIASSDSDTSCDEDNEQHRPLAPESDQIVSKDHLAIDVNSKYLPLLVAKDAHVHCIPRMDVEAWGSPNLYAQKSIDEFGGHKDYSDQSHNDVPDNDDNDVISNHEHAEIYEKKDAKRKPKKRVVSLSKDHTGSFLDDVRDE
ncbi:hypothetical protein RND81_09G073900 [Saponaria officinalis]|uniref:Outer arm dynein light chain 1 protein n=1 Tax=Saponaria officinalis TaxID=3572 RepID=A0AAW1IJV6_SAPOF